MLELLCYQLFENNGVIKREIVNETIKNISKEDRVTLRKVRYKNWKISYFSSKNVKTKCSKP